MIFTARRFLYAAWIFLALSTSARAAVVNAVWNTAADVPVTSSIYLVTYYATGNTVNFTLNFAPPTGTNLTVVNNTGLPFISGAFSNLTQGQVVNLSYNGLTYPYVANYYGGTGNDLVLVWKGNRPLSWGGDAYGQLGNNATTTYPAPVVLNTAGVLAGKTVTAIANGSNTNLALCSDGTLAAWGYNGYGQLGNNSTATSNLPVAVITAGTALDGKTVTAIAAGGTHCLALCSDGTLAAWGGNFSGQLGNTSTTQSNVPTAVVTAGTPLAGKTVIAISAGYSHCLALCSDGTVAVWGYNNFGQLGNNSTTTSTVPVAVTTSGALAGKTVIAVSASYSHSLALCSDGTVAAWGYNGYGQLGNNSTVQSNVPVAVTTSGVLSGKSVTAISTDYYHCLALCSDGTVVAWGNNSYGQLGNNSTTLSTVPVAVTSSGVLSGKTVVAVSAGYYHSLALCSDGMVAAWGGNSSYQLGSSTMNQSTVPVAVSASSNALTGKTVSAVTSGQDHSGALCSDGTVAMWGSNSYGQLGTGAAYVFPVPAPVTTTGTPLSGKTLIAHTVGGGHSLGLCSDGTLAAWGSNFNGQLGNNTTVSSSVPLAVTTGGVLAGKTVIAVAAGNSHSLALCSDGTVAAWGLNSNGQLGNSSTTQSTVPVAVTTSGVLSGKTVIAVATGTSHSLALCSDGTVAAWGANYFGQLGNNSTTQSTVPVAVVTSGVLSGKTVIAVAAGTSHSLALCSDGTAIAWGYNSNGQLGNNSTTNSLVPVAVVAAGTPLAGKTVIAVSGGYYHSLALCSDGTVAAWGQAIFGQLGNNSITQRTVPVAVTTSGALLGRTVTSISAGYYYSLALCADGTLVSWGYGSNGELGTANLSSTVPVAVNTSALMPNEKFVQASSGSAAYHNLAIVATPPPLPSIYVQASAGTNLLSGNTVDCGNSAVAVGITKTFTLGNSGTAALSISGVTIDGVNAADFTITTAPASTVAAGGTTTLVVTFTPGAAFGRNAALHVTSNDLYGSPFDLSLTGAGITNVTASYNSATDVPATSSSFNASGSTVNFTLNYAPVPGTTLTVMNNTGLGLVSGAFSNLTQGQLVNLSYHGVTYPFVACYYGGTGNDLVLVWAGSRLVSWGYNNSGQLGNNTTTDSYDPMTVTTSGTPLASRTLLALSAGNAHSLALCADGTLAAWGLNVEGELGNGSTTNSSIPVGVTAAGTPLSGKMVAALSAGYKHNLVLCTDGTLVSWGYNTFGQLGNNSTSNSSIPGAVTTAGTPLAGKTVVAVSAGFYHNLTLCADGTLATWGYNASGQLGNGSTTRSLVPVAVATAGTPLAGKSVVSFAAGGTHNIALCTDGTLVTWGSNTNGQLGNNSTTQSTVPVAVTTAGTVLAGKTVIGVAAGNNHSLALCSDGTVATWGANNYGQLGNNSTTDSSLPVGVSTSGLLAEKTVVRLMAGSAHSMVLCSDGTMAAWGNNVRGQLGNNPTSNITSSIPLAVSISTLGVGERFVLPASGQTALHNLSLVASPVPASATTLPASSATATTVVLNGTVNANGAAATVSFDYGLDNTYGTNVAGAPASITGADDTAVSTTLTGLAPNTTYHFRVNGSNGSGSANGADLTFTTPPLSPLQNWRQTNFGTLANSGSTADAADYDGDSIPNLIEYALNLSPTVTSKLPLATALSGANFEYTYSRSTAAVNAGTTFAVEWSGTLTATWSRSGVTQTVLSDDGTTQQVKAVIPVNAATTMFMRLSVTAPP